MILTAWNYAWSVFSSCFVLGIAVYLIDRKAGVYIYRFWYDVRHRKGAEMPKDVVRGFLYNQSTNRGVSVAVFLSTLYTLYMFWELGFHMNVVAEIFIWLVMPVALVLGFWSGGFVYRFLLKRSKYFDDFDRLKAQADTVGVGGLGKQALDAAGGLASGLRRFFPKKKPVDDRTVNGSAQTEQKAEPPAEDPRAVLRRFSEE